MCTRSKTFSRRQSGSHHIRKEHCFLFWSWSNLCKALVSHTLVPHWMYLDWMCFWNFSLNLNTVLTTRHTLIHFVKIFCLFCWIKQLISLNLKTCFMVLDISVIIQPKCNAHSDTQWHMQCQQTVFSGDRVLGGTQRS